ncbi:hypothetical protein, partial [Brachyspira hampsonii]|uniref:hypothetical protein n=1 Tax=Brachyspira hampsonii TaxID=1287055 RepID=UPI000587BD6B
MSKISSVTDILEDIENVKVSLIDEINKVKEEIDNKYSTLTRDFDKSIDEIKDAVLDKNNILQFYVNEKELLLKEVDELKSSFASLKDDILISTDERAEAFIDSEKLRIQSAIDDVFETLSAKISSNDDSISGLESSLSEYKSIISNTIDEFKDEISSIKDNHSYNDLIEERNRLEESFNSLKNDFLKIEDLEKDLSVIKDKVKGVDTSLNDEVIRLSDELRELKENLSNEYNSDITNENIDAVYEDFRKLNENLESFKETVIPQLSNIS